MTRSPRAAAGVLALLFLALHAPFLPASLEDHDSLNFALGLREFDVAKHQPHPPGYPLYMAAGKAANLVFHDEVRSLGALAVIGGALSIPALVFLFGYLDPSVGSRRWAILGASLSASAPLYWFTAVRPLSDMPGLAAVLGVQALLVKAATPRALTLGAGIAGLAVGIRSQVVWLTLPLLALQIARRPGAERMRTLVTASMAFAVGVLIWFVPLIVVSGGPAAYWQALANQGTEDLTGIAMLWTTPTPRQAITVLWAMFVAPWGTVPVAAVVAALAWVGLTQLLFMSRRTLWTLLVAFVPYAIFSALFQETVTTRYTVPLVPPVAYLAIRGIDAIGSVLGGWLSERLRRVAFQPVIAGTLVAANLVVAIPAVQAYSGSVSPSFQMLGDMAARETSQAPPVLAMHRRAEFDLRRPLLWAGEDGPVIERKLPSPPKREWLELVKYWGSGGSSDVWFIADPLRSDLALIGHPRLQATYRWTQPETPWPFDQLTMLGGVRPSEFDWYVIPPPPWYAGEGWALTPETAGVAREDKRAPNLGPIEGWIHRLPEAATLMIGGRNLISDGSSARVSLMLDGTPLAELIVAPGFFLEMIDLPAGRLSGWGPYAPLTIAAVREGAAGPTDVAIEQFDVAGTGSPIFGYADGWHEREYAPATGKVWRWTTERARVRLRAPARQLTLRLEGEVEAARQSQITIRAGDRVIARETIGRTFGLLVPLPADVLGGETDLVIETDQTYVPAERQWRSGDQRRLGLKVYRFEVIPAS